jgi:N6-L-threonylcarbamoyladenine synthase
MLGRPDCNFSFSGLKTALRQRVEGLRKQEALDPATVANLAAGFEIAVMESIADRTRRGIALARERSPGLTALVVAGGVAANRRLREGLASVAAQAGLPLVAPPIKLCTDNAAMIAWTGIEHLQRGEVSALDFAPRPRWPLDAEAPVLRGAGVKA